MRSFKIGGEIKKQKPTGAFDLLSSLQAGVLVVDRLTGQGEDPDLGHFAKHVFLVAAERQNLTSLRRVLHHLGDAGKTKFNAEEGAMSKGFQTNGKKHNNLKLQYMQHLIKLVNNYTGQKFSKSQTESLDESLKRHKAVILQEYNKRKGNY